MYDNMVKYLMLENKPGKRCARCVLQKQSNLAERKDFNKQREKP